jgi:hypothetical protein
MPRRRNFIRAETPDVQGEDSYIVVTLPTTKDLKELVSLESDDNVRAFESGADLIRKHVREWNWVNDDGEPLPLPKENPDVIDDLTAQEFRTVLDVMTGSADGKKKSAGN